MISITLSCIEPTQFCNSIRNPVNDSLPFSPLRMDQEKTRSNVVACANNSLVFASCLDVDPCHAKMAVVGRRGPGLTWRPSSVKWARETAAPSPEPQPWRRGQRCRKPGCLTRRSRVRSAQSKVLRLEQALDLMTGCAGLAVEVSSKNWRRGVVASNQRRGEPMPKVHRRAARRVADRDAQRATEPPL